MSYTAAGSEPAAPAAPAAAPHRFVAPKAPLLKRINMRLVLLGAIALLFVGFPFFIWARGVITGGIIHHGDYSDVDLKAMSSFDMDQSNGRETDVPQKFRNLEGQCVALVGQMWQQHSAGGDALNYFQLVYSKTKCCFNGPPLAQHFVDSNVVPGALVYDYGDEMVRVWGTLHIRFRRDGSVIKSVYAVDVDKVEPL